MNFFHKNEILSLHDSRVYRKLDVQFSNVECAMSPVVEDLTDDRKACEECAID